MMEFESKGYCSLESELDHTWLLFHYSQVPLHQQE